MSKLADLRYEKGKTINQVAADINVSPAAIFQWEQEATIPTPVNIAKLTAYYGVSEAELQLAPQRRRGRPPRYFSAGHPDGPREKVTAE